MTSRQLDEEAISHVARHMDSAQGRSDYLDQVCAGDAALRERVEALLRVHQQEQELLHSSPEPAPTVDQSPISESPGTQIGRYRLLQVIGEGGFGVVYEAEQQTPVQRKVALRIIKPGMDTRAVVARFEAERQALALMDHPNIARVFDGGATESGRPYFVMELVRGVPITAYCDANHLSTHDRLRLFVTVCQAVQHAHQKGIIHRDLKPSNIMITLHDSQPVVKVIDFGVAKATHQRLTERTLFTAYGQMVGTPQYMSPEQAEMSGLDVDTRSDVYSLGVLLYELLTGTTPLAGERLRTAGYAEMQRIIRDEEPLKPSTRLNTAGEQLTSIAKHRGVSPEQLRRLVCGDLDWIVMKSLEKDRTHRYDTVAGLAEDVWRFLNDQPVEARAPSRSYRVSKFIRRNRKLLGVVTAIVATLIAGIIGTTSGWLTALGNQQQVERILSELRTRESELRARLTELQVELTDRALDAAISGDLEQANAAIERARVAETDPGLLATLSGLALFYDGQSDKAIRFLEDAVLANPGNSSAWSVLFWAYSHVGRYGSQSRAVEHMALNASTTQPDCDRLLNAQGMLYSTYPKRQIIQRLSDLIRRHGRWGAAYAIRAEAWSELGIETKCLEDFERAVDDVEAAESMLPDNLLVLAVGLGTYIHAIQLRESLEGEPGDAAQWRARADELSSKLGKWPEYVEGRTLRATYYCFNGQYDLARQEEEYLLNRGVGGLIGQGLRLYEQHRLGEVANLPNDLANNAMERVFLDMLVAVESEGKEAALTVFRSLDLNTIAYEERTIVVELLFLLGDLKYATEMSRQLVKSGHPTSVWAWWVYRMNYLAGNEPEQDFLERAGPFSKTKCVAHYAIAMNALCHGERKKAKEHFTIASQMGKPGWWCYRCSKAFLAQMDDPAWPKWILSSDSP